MIAVSLPLCGDGIGITTRGEQTMQTEMAPIPKTADRHSSWPQRQRITTTDLMQGAREVVIVHAGEEYILRIAKPGKLILTK
jgi:hemin uptake protein HemP